MFAAGRPVCHDSSEYVVVEGSTGEVGTNFLIKHSSTGSKRPTCEYVVRDGDFEIKNELAEYFLALQNDLLILDSGAGPHPRGLIIWDLKKCKKVYTGTYSDITVHEGHVDFWLETGAATETNCPDLEKWQSQGLGARIETHVRLELPS